MASFSDILENKLPGQDFVSQVWVSERRQELLGNKCLISYRDSPPPRAAKDVEQKTSCPERTSSGPLLLLRILMAEGNPDTQK